MTSSRPLRIAMLSATFPPYYAGSGNACFYLSEELARRGHEVTVWTATYPGDPVDPAGVAVQRLRPVLRLGNAPLVPGLLRIRDVDLVHLHQPFIFGTDLAWPLCRARRIPLVSTFHNALAAGGLKGALFRAYDRTVTARAVRASARLAVLSLEHARAVRPLAAELERRPEAFVTVPNGVDDAFAPGDAGAARSELGLGAEDVVALVCAKLDAAHLTKRVDLALRAVARIDDKRLKLVVLGGGELQDSYEAQARELGLGARVRFLGDVPHARVPPIYRASDFLLMPSDLEAFPLVLIEAMATGKPSVITRIPGATRVSAEGEHGFQVAPGDEAELAGAIERMLAIGPDARAAMGETARAHVLAHYTWRHVADTVEGVYRDVLAEASAR